MKKIVSASSLAIVFTCFLFSACDKQAVNVEHKIETMKSEKYLEFQDFSDFDAKLNELNNKSSQELVQWESSVGFTTLHRLYENIIAENLKNIEKAELALKTDSHSSITLEAKKSQMMNECKPMLLETEHGLDLNLFDPSYAKLLNKDGVVKIGNALYKFDKTSVRYILDGDYTQLRELEKLTANNQTSNLKYSQVRFGIKSTKNAKVSVSDFTCISEVGGYRLDGWVYSYLYYTLNTAYGQYQYHYGAFARSTHRKWSNIFGWRSNPTNQYSLNANYSINVVNGNSWLPLPTTSSDSFNESNYDNYKTDAYKYFVSATSGLVPNGQSINYADLTLSGTFNFKFYDCECTASY